MKHIDLKDRKILYELDLNSRQSFRSIGRKVGLSKDRVISRVNKLQENGIISKFYTRCDISRLGLIAMRVYLKFQYVTPDKKIEIINHFMNCKYSTVIGTIEGNYDLLVVFIFTEFDDIYHYWIDTLKKYGDFFSDRVISIFADETDYPKSFLIDEIKDRIKLKTTLGISKKVHIDKIDKQIIELLGKDSRISTLEIAKTLKTTTNVINYRIKKMKKLGVILGFKLLINLNELGYKWYKADFFLRDYNTGIKIIKYLENNPNLICIDRTIGYADLELEFYLRSTDELMKIFENVSRKFPDTIKHYSYFRLVKAYKFFGVDDILNVCKEKIE
jgi:DNA-binding Lrp family transcriptional regulator